MRVRKSVYLMFVDVPVSLLEFLQVWLCVCERENMRVSVCAFVSVFERESVRERREKDVHQ